MRSWSLTPAFSVYGFAKSRCFSFLKEKWRLEVKIQSFYSTVQ
nr:MAG TPA: hypothetical protein [Caudoviricetes sp.]